jgi:serine protease Do
MGQTPDNPQLTQNNDAGGDQSGDDTATALGLRLAPLNDRMRERAGVSKEVQGVIVTGVEDGSRLAQAGIQPGDVIEQVNQEPVTTPEQAEAKLNDAQASKRVLLLVNRHGVHQYLALSTSSEDNG